MVLCSESMKSASAWFQLVWMSEISCVWKLERANFFETSYVATCSSKEVSVKSKKKITTSLRFGLSEMRLKLALDCPGML